MSYHELYFKIFAAIADALAALESGRIIQAMRILRRASGPGEDAHMDNDIQPNLPPE